MNLTFDPDGCDDDCGQKNFQKKLTKLLENPNICCIFVPEIKTK